MAKVLMINIRNEGNPRFIGDILCKRGCVTPVNKSDLKGFAETKSGNFLLNTTMSVVDLDLDKKNKTELELIKSQAIADARQELGPIMKIEIEKKLKKEMEKSFKSLEKKIADLVKEKEGFVSQIKSLTDQVDELKKGGSVSETIEDAEPEKPFKFDPENHTIEHRGQGKYFVMNLDDTKALDRAITADEKTEFEALQKKAD